VDYSFNQELETDIFFCCFEYFCRGFGFITFREAESVEKVLETHAEDPILIDQKMVNCSTELAQNCSPFLDCWRSVPLSAVNEEYVFHLSVSFQIDPKIAIPPKKLSNKVCNWQLFPSE